MWNYLPIGGYSSDDDGKVFLYSDGGLVNMDLADVSYEEGRCLSGHRDDHTHPSISCSEGLPYICEMTGKPIWVSTLQMNNIPFWKPQWCVSSQPTNEQLCSLLSKSATVACDEKYNVSLHC